MICCSTDGRLCVQLNPNAKKIIELDIIKFHPYETGGILIGKYDENRRVATIYLATDSPGDSYHGSMSFDRGIHNIAESIQIAKLNIMPSLHYIGEWHTHPNNSPSPSKTDLNQMQAFAKNRLYGIRSPLLLIVGGTPPGNLIWQFSLHQNKKPIIYFSQI